MKLSSNVVGGSNDENSFPHILLLLLLLTNTQGLRLRKAFANCFLANTKLSKTQLHEKAWFGGFLGRLLGSLLKTGLLLIGTILKH